MLTSKVRVMPDPFKRTVVRFTPWAQPTPSQVRRIIGWEARRWAISSWGLSNRVRCESTYNWAASNGTHFGLLQFAPSTFARGLTTMPHKVRVKTSRILWRATRIHRRYSNGTFEWEPGHNVKVRRTRILKGRIPTSPPLTHGWAQVRIASQALANQSAVSSSEWACSA